MNRISTGIRGLDQVLDGGYPQGATILVAGRPGSGKTILAHQMMFHNAKSDFKAVYFTTLAEPEIKVLKYQQKFSFFQVESLMNCIIYQDIGAYLRKHGPERLLITIDQLLKQHQPGLIIIDTIKSIMDMIPSYTEARGFLQELSLRLAVWGCTTLILGEYTEEEIDMRVESTIADGIIYMSGTEERRQQKRFLRILKMRGVNHASGENVFKISEDGIRIYPRINPVVTNQEYEQSKQRISTGVEDLDQMMDGGIPKGSTTLVSGAAGAGKTLFAWTGLQAGENVVYVTFEENPQQLLANAQNLGIDLKLDALSNRLSIMHVSPIELDVDEHVYCIQQKVKETSAQRLIIDSISAFEVGMVDKLKYTDYIWGLTDYFKAQGVSTLLTLELQDFGSLLKLTNDKISFVADNIIALGYIESDQDLKKSLRVVKMRGSKHSAQRKELLLEEQTIRLANF